MYLRKKMNLGFKVEKSCHKALSQLFFARNDKNFKNSLGFRVGKISRSWPPLQ